MSRAAEARLAEAATYISRCLSTKLLHLWASPDRNTFWTAYSQDAMAPPRFRSDELWNCPSMAGRNGPREQPSRRFSQEATRMATCRCTLTSSSRDRLARLPIGRSRASRTVKSSGMLFTWNLTRESSSWAWRLRDGALKTSEPSMRPTSRSLNHSARPSRRREEEHIGNIAPHHEILMGYKPVTSTRANTVRQKSSLQVSTLLSSTATFSMPILNKRTGMYP